MGSIRPKDLQARGPSWSGSGILMTSISNMSRTQLPLFILLSLFSGSLLQSHPPVDAQIGTLVEIMNYDWCHGDCGPFTTASTLICVQVDNRTLIGERKLEHDWQEYYYQLFAREGQSIPIRYDDRLIWLVTAEGKQIRFDQQYERDVMQKTACTAEIHRHMLKSLGDVKRPASVPNHAVLIPEGGRFFWHYYTWVRCTTDATENDDICTYWNKSGREDHNEHVVSNKDRSAVPAADLQIDPYSTRQNEVHLKNGTALVSDGRVRINGKLVTDQPKP